MDAIVGLLDGPRARRAFLLRCTMDPPWALHIRDEAPEQTAPGWYRAQQRLAEARPAS